MANDPRERNENKEKRQLFVLAQYQYGVDRRHQGKRLLILL